VRGDANPPMAAPVEVPRDEWIDALRGRPAVREPALAELQALLLRAARFELNRRGVPRAELEDMAAQAAGDAMVALLAKLDSCRGASRFTTWAYKFALLEAGVKARRGHGGTATYRSTRTSAIAARARSRCSRTPRRCAPFARR
jgi:RNA polymerase sigma-70 factor, ECF subfamily